MEHVSTYLKNLKFDPRLGASFIAKYLSTLRLVILITLAIVVFGFVAYGRLPRNLNPDLNIPIVIVNTVLPGAGPADVESLITIPLEDAVRGVDGVKTVTSSSRDSVSTISLEFSSGTDPDKAKSDVQSKVDGVSDLPTDVIDPSVQKLDFENQPIWVFNLVGNGDRASLIRFSRDLAQQLEDLGSVDKVDITGIDEREVQIVVKPESISSFGVNPLALSAAIKSGLNSFPAGTVRSSQSVFSLSIDPQVSSIDDLRNLQISLNGGVVKLSDIATVQEISKPDQNQSFISEAGGETKSSVAFYVYRLNTVNIDKAEHDANELVEKQITAQQDKFKYVTVSNAAEEITSSFDELQRDISITVGLVFIVLFLFLGIRQAIVAMLSIPLTFLITFIVMDITGIALSFIASFSLLLSLGLLVDDTIVVISAMTQYFRSHKFSPTETGLLVFKDFWIAIITTTITTVWAFIPLLLATGIIGEFIKPIPIVVSATLIASIFVALFITMPFMIFLLKPRMPMRVILILRVLLLGVIIGLVYLILPKNQIVLLQILAILILLFVTFQIRNSIFNNLKRRFAHSRFNLNNQKYRQYIDQGLISFRPIENGYSNVMHRILVSAKARRNTVIMVVIFSVFSFLLVPLGFVKSEFFPGAPLNLFYVNVELPAGSNLNVAKTEAFALMDQVKKLEGVKFITLEQGKAMSADGFGGGGSSNTFMYSVVLNEEDSTNKAQEVRNMFVNYTKGTVSVLEQSGGPPAGSDLQIKLFGPDLTTLDQYSNKVQDYLKTQPGVINISKSIKPGTSKLVFIPDQTTLAANGLSIDQIGGQLRIFASGFEADTIKLDPTITEDQDITIRYSSDSQTIEDIGKLRVTTTTGAQIPLLSLGKLELKSNPTLITREDGRRTISVSAGVTKGFNIAEKNTELEKFAGTLNLPTGYGWGTGGVNEENNNSVNSILQAMILSFLLIITTMVLQFNSFRRALVVMLVIPLSISGVFIIFALTQTPLSFPALIGILALFGIVVKNSILIVDKIVLNQKSGMEFTESVADAAASRLEPIALTSITAIVGLIPITLSDPLWRGLGGAIIAGLTFSGTIMLFFIPVVYYLIYNPYGKNKNVLDKQVKNDLTPKNKRVETR